MAEFVHKFVWILTDKESGKLAVFKNLPSLEEHVGERFTTNKVQTSLNTWRYGKQYEATKYPVLGSAGIKEPKKRKFS